MTHPPPPPAVSWCAECGHPLSDHETDGPVTTCLLVRVNRTNDPEDDREFEQCPCWIVCPTCDGRGTGCPVCAEETVS